MVFKNSRVLQAVSRGRQRAPPEHFFNERADQDFGGNSRRDHMGVIEQLALWITHAMDALGYTGLIFMMALESMVAPVPSEIVMPFAGFLVAQGRFSLVPGIAAASLGTILGSLIGYYMGRLGGYPLVLRFGRYLLLDKGHLDFTISWFEKRGELTIFVARFIPVVRHLISIPAGIGSMNLVRFSIFTIIGGTIWNTFLLLCGIWLEERWSVIHEYSREIDYVVLAAMLVTGVWWVQRQLRRRRASS
jgi:membrane protein DedA with SNARE-associated domain